MILRIMCSGSISNMRKKNIRVFCNIISAVLVVIFVIKTIINYFQYDAVITSAPFYVCILINAIFLIIPSIIVYIVGIIIDRRRLKNFLKNE